MSMAKPAIAPYPFTTLHPLVGCIEYRDGFRVLVADVPGLIDGASYGRGRGYDFLRHLERTKALIYIVDSAGVDGRDPVNDLKVLFDEISSYGDGVMIERPSLIVANKIDLIPDTARRDTLFKQLALVSKTAGITCPSSVYGISAGVTGDGLMPLSRGIRNIIENSIPN
jgi:GTP-binding protein